MNAISLPNNTTPLTGTNDEKVFAEQYSNCLELRKNLEFEKDFKKNIGTASKVSEVVTQFTFAARYIKDESNPFSLKGKSLIPSPWLPAGVSTLSAAIEVVTLGLRAKDIYETHTNVRNLDTAIRNIKEEKVYEKNLEEKEYSETELKISRFLYDVNEFRETQFKFYLLTGAIRVIGKVISCIPIPEAWGLRMVFWCLAWLIENVFYKLSRWCLNKLREKAFDEYKSIKEQLKDNPNIDLESEIYKKRSIIWKLFNVEESPTNQLEKRKETAEFILKLIELLFELKRKGINVAKKEKRINLYIQACVCNLNTLNKIAMFQKLISQNINTKDIWYQYKRKALKNTLIKNMTK